MCTLRIPQDASLLPLCASSICDSTSVLLEECCLAAYQIVGIWMQLHRSAARITELVVSCTPFCIVEILFIGMNPLTMTGLQDKARFILLLHL